MKIPLSDKAGSNLKGCQQITGDIIAQRFPENKSEGRKQHEYVQNVKG